MSSEAGSFLSATLDYDGPLGQESFMFSITQVDNAIYLIEMKGIIDVNGEGWETTPVYIDMLKSSGLSGFGKELSSTEQSEPEDTENEEVSRQVSSNDDKDKDNENDDGDDRDRKQGSRSNDEDEDGGDSSNSGSEGGNTPLQQQPQAVQQQQQQQQQSTGDSTGAGLNNACLKSGFTQAQCDNYLESTDPGQYCTTLKLAGLPCPQIQDPAKTYGDPKGALAESNQKIEQTENAIEGFNRLGPVD